MAGDWIKMRKSLTTDPRLVRIMSALNADRFRTLGGVLSAWCLLDDQTEDGQLDGYTSEVFDAFIGFPGLCQAMIDVGWMVETPKGLTAVNFTEHNGQTAKRRAQENVRKMSARNADKTRTESGPEKRREEKSIKKNKSTREMSKHWNESEEFRECWMAWLSHVAHERGPISEAGEQQQLYELARFDTDEAIAVVRFSTGRAKNLILNGDHKNQSRQSSDFSPRRKRTIEEMLPRD